MNQGIELFAAQADLTIQADRPGETVLLKPFGTYP